MSRKKFLAILLTAGVSFSSIPGINVLGAEYAEAITDADIFDAGEEVTKDYFPAETEEESVEMQEIFTEESAETEEFSDEEPIIVPYEITGVLQAGGYLDAKKTAVVNGMDQAKAERVIKYLKASIYNCKEEIRLHEFELRDEEFDALFTEALNEMPGFFAVDVNAGIRYVSSKGQVLTVLLRYTTDLEGCIRNAEKYENEIDKFMYGVEESWTDLEKALYAHEFLAETCSYDDSRTKHSAYDAIVNHSAVCSGYAEAYADLMRRLGIECTFVGSGKLNHVWNMVKIDGCWYHVDVTWDGTGHSNFLKSEQWFRSKKGGHDAPDIYYRGGKHIPAESTLYDDAFWSSAYGRIYYDQNYWYSFEGFKYIKKYRAGSLEFVEEIKNITYDLDEKEVIDSMTYGGYDCLMYNGIIYYSTPYKIHSIDRNGQEQIFHEINEREKQIGYIRYFSVDENGILKYTLFKGNTYKEAHEIVLSTHQHQYDTEKVLKEPKCGEEGRKRYYCSICGAYYTKIILPTGEHDWTDWETYQKSSLIEEGSIERRCKSCGYVDSKIIEQLKKISLSSASLTYNGKVQHPAVKVTDVKNQIVDPSNYKVTYSRGCKDIGTYWVEVSFKNPYDECVTEYFDIIKPKQKLKASDVTAVLGHGASVKTVHTGDGKLSYKSDNTKIAVVYSNGKIGTRGVGTTTITVTAGSTKYSEAVSVKVKVTVLPEATVFQSVKSDFERKVSLSWKKTAGVTGYYIQYSDNPQFKNGKSLRIKGDSSNKTTISGLAGKKNCYFRIRTYKTVAGKSFYSKWSSVKKVKVR